VRLDFLRRDPLSVDTSPFVARSSPGSFAWSGKRKISPRARRTAVAQESLGEAGLLRSSATCESQRSATKENGESVGSVLDCRLKQFVERDARCRLGRIVEKFGNPLRENCLKPGQSNTLPTDSPSLPSSPSAGTRRWRAAQPTRLREAFLRDGRAPRTGEIFRFPDQAKTLEKIAATKGEAFYRGISPRKSRRTPKRTAAQ